MYHQRTEQLALDVLLVVCLVMLLVLLTVNFPQLCSWVVVDAFRGVGQQTRNHIEVVVHRDMELAILIFPVSGM